MAQILDGKWVRDQILARMEGPRQPRSAATKRPSGTCRRARRIRSRFGDLCPQQDQSLREMGVYSEKHTPPESVTTEELLALVESLNRARGNRRDSGADAACLAQVDSRQILVAVRPDKDVDGFHPVNVGNLVANIPGPRPCTPSGIIELLKRYKIPISGRNAVVIGRSDIVGKPMALLLLHESATVTDLPLSYVQSARGMPTRRHPGCRHWPARVRHARTSSSRAPR